MIYDNCNMKNENDINMIKKNLFPNILKRVLLCLNKIEFCNNT